ncbi:unnamed protein product [Lactuca virosa]|uniref:Uncharacterized protein n=1 Tax=Lactuca virosa TaxID=75947 RepID=A0AAU9MMH0_9ASTR|nr:unnamed protein product [Lactuca virosa]
MDSTVYAPSSQALIQPISSSINKNVKMESGSGKPSSSSTRAAMKATTVEAIVVTMNPYLESNIPGSSLMLIDTSSIEPSSNSNPLTSCVDLIPSSGKEASIHTLVNLAASLPPFQCPFTTTTVPTSPDLASASDEETLDKAHYHLMEGMHLLNEVSAHTKVRKELLAQRQAKFEEGQRKLKEIGKIHERNEQEAQELQERVKGLSERNVLLVGDLSESIRCQNELKNLNEDLQIKADDAIGRRSVLAKDLEEKTHRFESLKL